MKVFAPIECEAFGFLPGKQTYKSFWTDVN